MPAMGAKVHGTSPGHTGHIQSKGISMTILSLVQKLRELHFSNPPATESQIEAFERRSGYSLPLEMRLFYKSSNGACLFDKTDPPYKFLSLADIQRARVSLLGVDDDEHGPASWYAFCDVRDGNYVAIDLDPSAACPYSVIDCFHETFPDPEYCSPIASSFTDFLEGALSSGGEGLYWLRS